MLAIRFNFLILFFSIFMSFALADNNKTSKLDKLFEKLAKINNPITANLLEKEIWKVWSEHPSDLKLTNKLAFGKELMNEGSYNYALKVFTNIIKTDPSWPEGWNARATLLFYMNDYEGSLNDIDNVLNLEPRHFGALSGRAQISIRLKLYEKALNDLKKVKKIHPLITEDKMIEELEKLITGFSI